MLQFFVVFPTYLFAIIFEVDTCIYPQTVNRLNDFVAEMSRVYSMR